MKRGAIAVACTLLAACVRPGAISDPVRLPAAPTVTVVFMGTAVQPWPELDLALEAIEDVAHLGEYELQVWGANDLMEAPSTPDPHREPDGTYATTFGSTEENECLIFGMGCRAVLRVRQLRKYGTPKDLRQPKIEVWTGPVLAIDEPDTSTPQHTAAIWDEPLCRLFPRRTHAPWPKDYGPECDALRAKARGRYAVLLMQRLSK